MDTQPDDPPAPDVVRFRPGKKRKAYRQRPDDDAVESTPGATAATGREQPPPTVAVEASPTTYPDNPDENEENEEDDDEEGAVAAALRLRNARKAKFRGVGFRSDARPDDHRQLVMAQPSTETDIVPAGIANRFTHQTGLIGALNDRHM